MCVCIVCVDMSICTVCVDVRACIVRVCMHCMCGCVSLHCMWTYVHTLYVDVCAGIVCVNLDTHLDNLGCQSFLTVPNLSTVEEEAAVTV